MGISPTTMRLSVAACTTTDELREAVGVLKTLALQGDVKALALLLKYVEPYPSKRCAPVSIDEKQLETVEGCRAAYMDIMRELAAGTLDHDSAAALRATVEGALKTHTAGKQGDAMEALADAAAGAFFLDAADPDASLEEWRDVQQQETPDAY